MMRLQSRIGTILAAPAFFILLASFSADAQPLGFGTPQQPQESHYGVLCSAAGRFVFGQVSDSSKDQFMLDTVTGRLWQIAESGEIGVYLRPVPYRTAEGEYNPLPGQISEAKSEEAQEKK